MSFKVIALLFVFSAHLAWAKTTIVQHLNKCARPFQSATISSISRLELVSINGGNALNWSIFERTPGADSRFDAERLGSKINSLFNLSNLRGKAYLDSAMGEGEYVAYLQRNGIENAVGIDIALSAEQKGKDYFFQGDVQDTGFESNIFDIELSSYNVFSYPSSPELRLATLKELVRTAKPNGLIVIIAYRALSSKAGRPIPPYAGNDRMYQEMIERLLFNKEDALRELTSFLKQIPGVTIEEAFCPRGDTAFLLKKH